MRRDDAYLLDMLMAARKAVTFTEELTYAQFMQSDLHQNAVLKVLEIVGEGASRVSESARNAYPEISWSHIIGFRNRIVHGYFEIDFAIVWKIVEEDLPPLITQLELLVSPEPEK
ncbi:MAG: DUF86 domain-containing protein [Gammaproteobacteria bacterium]|nr:DUF86 domain-containing protein [Gammaproteobacteria bacterium]